MGNMEQIENHWKIDEIQKEKAELERFSMEQQQIIAQAQAKREASELDAEQRRILADAQAYEITQLNEAIAKNPAASGGMPPKAAPQHPA